MRSLWGLQEEGLGKVSMQLLASLGHCCRMLLATFDSYNLSLFVSWKEPITNLVPAGQDTEPNSYNSFAETSGVSVTALQGAGTFPMQVLHL